MKQIYLVIFLLLCLPLIYSTNFYENEFINEETKLLSDGDYELKEVNNTCQDIKKVVCDNDVCTNCTIYQYIGHNGNCKKTDKFCFKMPGKRECGNTTRSSCTTSYCRTCNETRMPKMSNGTCLVGQQRCESKCNAACRVMTPGDTCTPTKLQIKCKPDNTCRICILAFRILDGVCFMPTSDCIVKTVKDLCPDITYENCTSGTCQTCVQNRPTYNNDQCINGTLTCYNNASSTDCNNITIINHKVGYDENCTIPRTIVNGQCINKTAICIPLGNGPDKPQNASNNSSQNISQSNPQNTSQSQQQEISHSQGTCSEDDCDYEYDFYVDEPDHIFY